MGWQGLVIENISSMKIELSLGRHWWRGLRGQSRHSQIYAVFFEGRVGITPDSGTV
jgi:hypothetical protein